MNDKKRELLEEFLREIPQHEKQFFNELSEYVVSLGYLPYKTKTRIFNLDFSNSKFKKTIMKLEAPDMKYEGSVSGIRLKFYANKDYSDIFKKSIQHVIEAFDGRYTGCYGCGRCNGGLEGYTFTYPDGKKVFRCGGELIRIKDWNNSHLSEIKKLIQTQNEFWNNL